ncbi:hypothetical protein V1J52_06810 [Streptomyces sp. TRM 70351]|uniref:hypothetical protein n=1 Tax=Streptomyces sp. TRM 70351 TaxID=3116552 RepID=UPI002E7B19B0|nr:hypothetical protein [Streptomyces sp. TRM 70351]MEE1927905.1 hypothetical protein [Streptomyces sp. TRM 70351]
MSKGTRKTLGVAALGAALAASAAGTASAVGPADTMADLATNGGNMSVEDAVMDLPQNALKATDEADRAAVTQDQNAVTALIGGLPVVGALAQNGLPTDALTGGGLPTDGLTGGKLPTDSLSGLPVGSLSNAVPLGGLPL